MTDRIRVLVVEPCPSLRRAAAESLRLAGCEVTGTAVDGFEALHMALTQRPDVILTAVLAPGIDGVEITTRVMASAPTAVVLWSAYGSDAEVRRACDGLRAGAIEVCAKPTGGDDNLWRAVVSTVLAAARVGVRRSGPAGPSGLDAPSPVVVIGASTGGPRALRRILAPLPADLAAPIVVALHGSCEAGPADLGWLQGVTTLEVRAMQQGAAVDAAPGRVWLSPPGLDVEWRGGRLYTRHPLEPGRASPSIDRLFRSTALNHGPRAIGVLLTGMGADGAAGLAAIRAKGGRTIVQSTASAVISSMPAAALARGAADHQTDLDRIPGLLRDMLATGG